MGGVEQRDVVKSGEPEFSVLSKVRVLPLQELTPPSPSDKVWCYERETRFVEALVDVTTKLINHLWPAVATGQRSLSLRIFISETLRRSQTSFSTLQLALYYVVHSCAAPAYALQSTMVSRCGRRTFLSALMLSTKFLQDQTYTTRAWSRICGLGCKELNRNEADLLMCLDYKLAVASQTFTNWGQSLTRLAGDRDMDAFLSAWLDEHDCAPTAAYRSSSSLCSLADADADDTVTLLNTPYSKHDLPLSPPESLPSSPPKRLLSDEEDDHDSLHVAKRRRT